MQKFILKLQNCLLKNLSQDTIHLSSYRLIDETELENFDVVFTYPNEEVVKYFESIGFRIYVYDKLPPDALIFSKNEFLDYLLDDDMLYPEPYFQISKVIYS